MLILSMPFLSLSHGKAVTPAHTLWPQSVLTHLPLRAASPHCLMNRSTSLFFGVSCDKAFSSQCTCTGDKVIMQAFSFVDKLQTLAGVLLPLSVPRLL